MLPARYLLVTGDTCLLLAIVHPLPATLPAMLTAMLLGFLYLPFTCTLPAMLTAMLLGTRKARATLLAMLPATLPAMLPLARRGRRG